jgi:hypothetical protein
LKFFQHDTDSIQNRKLRKVLRIHGAVGYGVWWALLEQLYAADEAGFQIIADDLWMEDMAERLHLSDNRTLTRVFDTFAQTGLISAQAWAEKLLFCEQAVHRGDAYAQKKLKAAQKKRAQRAGSKELEPPAPLLSLQRPSPVPPMSPICPQGQEGDRSGQIEKVQMSPPQISDLDLDIQISDLPDPVFKKTSLSEKSAIAKRDQTPRRQKKNGAEEVYSNLEDREKFEKSWVWYCSRLKQVEPDKQGRVPSPGSKLAAARSWREHIELPGKIEQFRYGAAKFDFRQIGIPHFCRFLSGGLWDASDTVNGTQVVNDFIGTLLEPSDSNPGAYDWESHPHKDEWFQLLKKSPSRFMTVNGVYDQERYAFYQHFRHQAEAEISASLAANGGRDPRSTRDGYQPLVA